MERHLYTWCGTNSIHKACYRSFIQGLGQIVYTGVGTDVLHRALDRAFSTFVFANKMFVLIQSEFVILYITVLSVFMKTCDSFIPGDLVR